MSEETILKILKESKTIAVIGLSPKHHRSSYGVSEKLQSVGYKIIPVYPREDFILGEKVYRNVSDIPEKVDTVCIFRRSEEVMSVIEDAINADPKYIWMQQGIVNEEAKKLAEAKGITVIMDRCMSFEYAKKRNKL